MTAPEHDAPLVLHLPRPSWSSAGRALVAPSAAVVGVVSAVLAVAAVFSPVPPSVDLAEQQRAGQVLAPPPQAPPAPFQLPVEVPPSGRGGAGTSAGDANGRSSAVVERVRLLADDRVVDDHSTTPVNASRLAANGVPEAALAGYRNAAARLGQVDPGCRVTWSLLAAIGRVESNHGRFGRSVLTTGGVSVPPVLGVRLDGSLDGTAVIVDSDGGALDGDPRYDRAVGAMQFLPGTWARYGADGDGDGVKNPQDLDDAALAAAAYLCSGADDLSTPDGARSALFRYNRSSAYGALVMGLGDLYATGVQVDQLPLPAPPQTPVPVTPEAPTDPAAPPLTPVPSPTATTTEPTSPVPTSPVPTTPVPTTPVPTTPVPTTPVPTTPVPTTPVPTTPVPTTPVPTSPVPPPLPACPPGPTPSPTTPTPSPTTPTPSPTCTTPPPPVPPSP